MKDWLDDASRITTDNPIRLIIGNKCDLDYKKEVFESDIKSFEEQTGIPIVQASAKESIKINEIMYNITKKLIERADNKENGLNTFKGGKKINEGNVKNENSNCC